MTRPDYARELRYLLVDPVKLCRTLGLADGAQPQASGLLIRCPAHGDRKPSCSVTLGPDGSVRVKCFACDFATDALGLIAQVRGLSLRSQFPEVLAEAAHVAGRFDLEAEIRDGKPAPDRAPPPEAPPPAPPRLYPPSDEVHAIWDTATPVADDRDAARYLVFRKIDPELIAMRQLARVIAPPVPPWATYGKVTWVETGHRMISRMFDAHGELRSVRAIRIADGKSPKRLPPKGYKAAELVLANESAWRMLRGRIEPSRVVVTEGEPDFCTWGALTTEPVIGVISGSWTDAFAERVPRGCRVVVRTHEDDAGERYAAMLIASLKKRDCTILRSNERAA
jgi:hypothetical protein